MSRVLLQRIAALIGSGRSKSEAVAIRACSRRIRPCSGCQLSGRVQEPQHPPLETDNRYDPGVSVIVAVDMPSSGCKVSNTTTLEFRTALGI